ncbi:MAG: hypothetical protein WC055_16235 [Melioribacteraceae bacterium]
MNQIALVGVLILIFGLIYLMFYFTRILISLIQANRYGLRVNLKQAKVLWRDSCLKKEFLLGVKEIWDVYPIPIENLTMHYLAGGNLNNIKNGLVEFSLRNREPNVWFLTTFDLAKRNLPDEIDKAEKNDWKFEL